MFLISEAVRGEGAVLRNSAGEAFMYNKHSLRDLAPRDIVTREILKNMAITGDSVVYLDVSDMDEAFFSKRFPTIFEKCRSLGINVPQDHIPVHPTEHYLMGGIKTDLHARTAISGLYACGEVALHRRAGRQPLGKQLHARMPCVRPTCRTRHQCRFQTAFRTSAFASRRNRTL